MQLNVFLIYLKTDYSLPAFKTFCSLTVPYLCSISILYSLKTPDHWYMRYNIIIYKLQWFTGEGHKKGEAKYNKCKNRKNKYKIHAFPLSQHRFTCICIFSKCSLSGKTQNIYIKIPTIAAYMKGHL